MAHIDSNNRLFSTRCTRALVFIVSLGFMTACMQDGRQAIEETTDPLVGAWGGQEVRGDQRVDVVVIFTPAHQVAAWFDPSTGSLIHSNGGLWSRTGNHVTETVEFDSDRPERAGTDVSFDIILSEDSLSIVGSDSWLVRIDHSDQDMLGGAWELQQPAPQPAAKRVRMMSSTRFQEIQYEPESGVILSLMGGSYRIDGEEYIETTFFSSEPINTDISTPYSVEREGEVWSQVGAELGEREWRGR